MTVEHPYYRFSLIGQPRLALDGRPQAEAVYQHWTRTDQCVFYVEGESVAVGEDLWEFDDAEHALIKLDPSDVLSVMQAAALLEPLIKPLPPFDTAFLPR